MRPGRYTDPMKFPQSRRVIAAGQHPLGRAVNAAAAAAGVGFAVWRWTQVVSWDSELIPVTIGFGATAYFAFCAATGRPGVLNQSSGKDGPSFNSGSGD